MIYQPMQIISDPCVKRMQELWSRIVEDVAEWGKRKYSVPPELAHDIFSELPLATVLVIEGPVGIDGAPAYSHRGYSWVYRFTSKHGDTIFLGLPYLWSSYPGPVLVTLGTVSNVWLHAMELLIIEGLKKLLEQLLK